MQTTHTKKNATSRVTMYSHVFLLCFSLFIENHEGKYVAETQNKKIAVGLIFFFC